MLNSGMSKSQSVLIEELVAFEILEGIPVKKIGGIFFKTHHKEFNMKGWILPF